MRRDGVGCRGGGSQGFVRWEAPEVKVIIGGDGERAEKAVGLKGDEMSRCGSAEERSTRGMSGAWQGGGVAGTREGIRVGECQAAFCGPASQRCS